MDKKFISHIIGKNLSFLIFSIIMTMYFMRDVNQALYVPSGMGMININSVEYTLFQFKIDVIQGNFHHLYIIDNYPLIPIFIGIIYNIYFWFKTYRENVH